MIKGSRIILTGGCGFIGNTLTRLLIAQNPSDLLIIDKLTYVSNNEYHKKNKIPLIKLDIATPKAYQAVIDFKPDIIINMAAESHVDKSIDDPNIFVTSNVYGTINLMNAALKLPSLNLYLQISTDEVYGDVEKGWSKETDPRITSSPYSASKAAAEMFVEAYGRTFKLPYIITRSSNNYGPYQHTEKFIPKIINNLLSGKKIPVFGTGEQQRDWVYVDDNCKGICELINNSKLALNSVFNIGGVKTYTNISIVKRICKLMDKDPVEFIQFVADRPGHDHRYAIDTKKIKQTIGWQAKTDLTDGLKQTISWYQERF